MTIEQLKQAIEQIPDEDEERESDEFDCGMKEMKEGIINMLDKLT